MTPPYASEAIRLSGALTAVAIVTVMFGKWLHVANAATVSIAYLLIVLVVAATSRLRVAVLTSMAAMLCLNFFFLPPVGKFLIADSQNWVALFAFLVVSLVASHLSAVAQARTQEAVSQRDQLAALLRSGTSAERERRARRSANGSSKNGRPESWRARASSSKLHYWRR